MQVAVCTVSLPEYVPEEALVVLAELGYEGVEWRIIDQRPAADGRPGFWAGNRCTWPLSSLLEDAARIRALTEQAGLAMPSLGTYVRSDQLEEVERAMQGAVLLGVPQLRVNLPAYDGKSSYLALRELSLRQYAAVERLADRYGVRALIEIHHGSLIPSASAAAAFVSRFDPRCIGVIHDAGNMIFEGFEQYRLGLELLGTYLAHVHLKNAVWRPAESRADGSVHWQAEWSPLQRGIVDIGALLQLLGEMGYDGWLSLEDFSTERPLAERLHENLNVVRRAIAQLPA